MNTKESIHVRTNERNREGKSGKWTAGKNNSGDIMAMTNVPETLKEMQRFGNKASKRTVGIVKKEDSHEEEIFTAVMRGMAGGLRMQGRTNPGEEGLAMAVEENNWEAFYDNLSGAMLDPEGVKNAGKEEMAEVYKHGVYVKVPVEECYEKTGKAPIGTRWVDVNKGDSVHPEYRSRLVAQEINTGKREDLFAATPPLEAKKILMSMAVAENIG